MSREGRQVALPEVMQGTWVDVEEPTYVVEVAGGEVVFNGRRSEYDYKEITHRDGAVIVDFGVEDEALEDDFARGSINGLALTPEGVLHMWNMKFACQLRRNDRPDQGDAPLTAAP